MLRLLTILCVTAIIGVNAKPPKRIVGGYNAQDGEYPWQVSINHHGKHICGGSIISNKHILTAAHCVIDVHNNIKTDLVIIAGTKELGSGKGNRYEIQTIIPHENYKPGNGFINDIALITVKNEIVFNSSQSPIPLPTYDAPANVDAMVSGWGEVTSPDGIEPAVLQNVMLITLDNKFCQKFHKAPIDANQFCAMKKKNVGVCEGDTGGPLVYGGALIGITSHPRESCGKGGPDVFVRVYRYLDWIQEAAKKSA